MAEGSAEVIRIGNNNKRQIAQSKLEITSGQRPYSLHQVQEEKLAAHGLSLQDPRVFRVWVSRGVKGSGDVEGKQHLAARRLERGLAVNVLLQLEFRGREVGRQHDRRLLLQHRHVSVCRQAGEERAGRRSQGQVNDTAGRWGV